MSRSISPADSGNLITFGGFWADGQGITGELNTSEILNTEQGVWIEGPRLHHARQSFASFQARDVVYVFGGYSNGQILRSVEKYEAGLVAHYPLDGKAINLVGTNHGTLVNVTLAQDRFGDPNSAYYFTGDNFFIIASNALTIDSLTNRLTLSAWIKIDAGITYDMYDYRHIISKGATPGDLKADYAMGLANPTVIRPAGALHWENSDGSGLHAQFGSGVSIPEGAWHHVAVTFESPAVNFYWDGVLVATNTSLRTPIRSSTQPLYIGCRYNAGSVEGEFQGAIDDVRIYNRALSAEEIGRLAGVTFVNLPITMELGTTEFRLTWGSGALLSADNLDGPWTPVPGASPPWTVTPNAGKKFYRLKQ